MKELIVYGRGGQGSVTAAELIAKAAFIDGKEAQAFPNFGVERRGAPVMAFARISDKPIRTREQIYTPEYVLLQDVTLMSAIDIFKGVHNQTTVIINTEKKAKDLKGIPYNVNIYTVPATQVAIDLIGRPIVNTLLIGYFAKITGEVTLKSVEKAINEKFSKSIAEKNIKAVRYAFMHCDSKSKYCKLKPSEPPYMRHRFGVSI